MSKNFILLGAVSALVAVSCSEKTSGNFIHYTDANLDEQTIVARQTIADNAKLITPQTHQQVLATIACNASLSYDELAGTYPDFSEEYEVTPFLNEKGYRTLSVYKKGGAYDYNVLYIHGGAFFMGLDRTRVDFCEYLLDNLNGPLCIPLYPLAPKNTVSDTFEMLLPIYKSLLEQKKPVYLIGESAGGNILLCFTLYLKKLGIQLPDALFPISPICDFCHKNPEMWKKNETDIILSKDMIIEYSKIWGDKGMAATNPKISPINGDLKGLPPTLMFVGTEDSLYPDCMKMYEKMAEAGVRVGILVGNGLWHDAIIYNIPARNVYLQEVLAFMPLPETAQ